MEKFEIQIDNKVIPYYLLLNDNKNCYIRVVEGRIEVRAGRQFSRAFIERSIIERKDSLFKLMNNYCQSVNFEDHYLRVYGKEYTMVFKEAIEMDCKVIQNMVYFYGQDYKEVVYWYLYNTLKVYISKKVMEYNEAYFNFKLPSLELKRMKSRWGYCKLDGHLCFNTYLIHLDKDLIDYVILHELCHFIVPNHSKAFYDEIEKRMPDYKRRIKEIKKETL